jgi:hypothetical protein
MSLLNEVKKTKPPRKSEVIRLRCSPHFRKLLDYFVDKTGTKTYSSFIRRLVMVATAESKNDKLINTLKKDLDSHEY